MAAYGNGDGPKLRWRLPETLNVVLEGAADAGLVQQVEVRKD